MCLQQPRTFLEKSKAIKYVSQCYKTQSSSRELKGTYNHRNFYQRLQPTCQENQQSIHHWNVDILLIIFSYLYKFLSDDSAHSFVFTLKDYQHFNLKLAFDDISEHLSGQYPIVSVATGIIDPIIRDPYLRYSCNGRFTCCGSWSKDQGALA